MPFYDGKMARILAHKNGEFHLFDETKFLYTYMGVFWSEATPIFTTIFCRMTRVVKIVPMFQTMVNFIFFPLIGKMVKFIFFPLIGKMVKFIFFPATGNLPLFEAGA